MNLFNFNCLFVCNCVLLTLLFSVFCAQTQQLKRNTKTTNIYGLRDATNEAVVEVIRKMFLLEVDTNPHLYHPIDVDRCRTEGWQIERFLLEKGTPEEALKSLIKAMHWKKSFGVHERSGHYFPIEMLRIFGNEVPSHDREGTLCFWGHSSVYRKMIDFDQLIKQYAVYYFEKVDREAGNRGFIVINNAKGVSIGNVDMGLARFSIDLMENYPYSVRTACTIDLLRFIQPLVNTIRTILPKSIKDRIVICNREELTQYIDIDVNEIPVSIGGKRQTLYDMSKDMRPLSQCKHLGFTDQQIDNFYYVYNFDQAQTVV